MARKRYIGIPGGGWAEMVEQPVYAGVMVMPDIQPYRNMVDGAEITSRSHHREFLRANHLIEVGNEVQSQQPRRALPGLKQQIAEIASEKLRSR